MSNLFKTELLRHCNWMVIVAIAHFSVLYYMFSISVAFTDNTVGFDWIIVISLAAAIFGVFQMKLHSRSKEWVYLLHRPLPPARIHLALTLAGSALLIMTLLLPALLVLVVMHIDGRLGTEPRHYQMVIVGGATVLTAYSIGQFAVLGASRLAFLALLPMATVFEPFTKTEQLIPLTFVTLLALATAHLAFEADLRKPGKHPAKLLPGETLIAIGCYILLLNFFSIYFTAQTDCDFSPVVAGHDGCIVFSDDREQLQFALVNSTHPDAAALGRQVMLSEVISVSSSQRSSYPERNQLPVRDAKQYLMDASENAYWLFSHSNMLYAGYDIASGELIGWLAPDGFYKSTVGLPVTRFGSVPLAAANDYLVDDHHVYQIDWQRRKIHERFVNASDERFSDSLFVGEKIATLFSDRHLFVFNANDLQASDTTLVPNAVLDITSAVEPGFPFSNNSVMELSKGYLVTSRQNAPRRISIPELGTAPARLQVWRALPGEAGELISELPLKSPYSEFSTYASFVAAPGIRVVTDAFGGFKLGKSREQTFPLLYTNFPSWVVTAALAVCGLSAGLAGWLLRSSSLSLTNRLFWVMFCALAGLPGLLAFVGGYYWRGRDILKLPLPSRATEPASVPV